MKISWNWLQDYLDIDQGVNETADILTAVGLEVEGVEEHESVKGGLKGLVIGEVKTCVKHPDADKLKLTTVDVGADDLLQIVCGAPNVDAGQKVVVAPPKTTIYPTAGEPFQIKRAKIRGVESNGMICAEDEIGLGTEHDGIIVLPADAKVGMPASEFYKIENDYILEIGLTPNRADAYSHLGTARDLMAALKVNLEKNVAVKFPDTSSFQIDNNDLEIAVEVKNHEACPRYSGVSITGLKIAESPDWLKTRLNAVGVRPINNVVDITNFILHEYGQPLHAFDADKIRGNKVIVQTLPAGTKFKTLDDQERTLEAQDLMICDAEGGMCIGGVFGGIASGVTDNTTSIFLESAHFDSTYIRRTSTHHNLRTDAASRFEKGTDPEMTVEALKRAALLIKELAGGQIASEIVDIYPNPVEEPKVTLRYEFLERLGGVKIPNEKVKEILVAAGISIENETDSDLNLSIPTYKPDVFREADVVEEILRIYGFDKIPLPELLRTNTVYAPKPDKEKYQKTVSDFLVANGLFEQQTIAITRSKYVEDIFPEDNERQVRLMNSLNAELNVMRTSMVFGGLETIRHNQNRQASDLKLFEFGKIYFRDVGHRGNEEAVEHKPARSPSTPLRLTASNLTLENYGEEEQVSIFLTGNHSSESWQEKQRPVTFYDLKQLVNQVLQRCGIDFFVASPVEESPLFQYGMEYSTNGKTLVTLGSIAPKVRNYFDIKNEVFFAGIHWEEVLKIAGRKQVKFSEIPKFPSVRRDLALVLDKKVSYAEVEKIASKTGKQLLKESLLFDVFEGKQIGEDKKSYAIGLIFQHPHKTLTDKEIDKVMNKMINNYEREIGAVVRK